MSSLAELARIHTALDAAGIAHLERLLASWGLLADLSFADLLLFAPTAGREDPPEELVVIGHVRPMTAQTLYRTDWVGSTLPAKERPIVSRCLWSGEVLEGEVDLAAQRQLVRVLAVPVRHEGRTIAVLTKESTPNFGRQPGELERTYIEVFNRFVRMIAAGVFPFPEEDIGVESLPRVGDGVILLDRQMRVEYLSPNGVSTLHRVGLHRDPEGLRWGELGLDESPVRDAFAAPMPVAREIELAPERTLVVRCLPLVADGQVTGALVILRDISELRRRDRLLLSKDATIREIHHRVKNNLQTISSLLRLQGRRLGSPEAKAAIEESVRRVRSIALVHEILSREAGEDVPFVEIVTDLARMAEEAFAVPDRPVRCLVVGDPGTVPAAVATPLAVVLNELLQNAADHAFPAGSAGGTVEVALRREDGHLVVEVTDDGRGVPESFDVEAAGGLGLSIVRTLVTSELAGELEVAPAPAGRGTRARIRVPIDVVPA